MSLDLHVHGERETRARTFDWSHHPSPTSLPGYFKETLSMIARTSAQSVRTLAKGASSLPRSSFIATRKASGSSEYNEPTGKYILMVSASSLTCLTHFFLPGYLFNERVSAKVMHAT